MSSIYLSLTPRDPLIARDGRPFGAGQGNRMRSLTWPLPSVVAGSFRTALVKAKDGLAFDNDMPDKLLKIAVAGVFPYMKKNTEQILYLPAPSDCVWDEKTNRIHRVQPISLKEEEGVNFPVDGLWPVRLSREQAEDDFKAKSIPTWWPSSQLADWLTLEKPGCQSEWFKDGFLNSPIPEYRDHVCLDADRGAAAESQLFATAGLNVAHLPRYGVRLDDKSIPFEQRYAETTLTARVTIRESDFEHVSQLKTWHPLGGERRLVHWQANGDAELWKCPDKVKHALASAKQIRMVLATPAIFTDGWKPGWLKNGLEGELHGVKLELVGVSNSRWKAVSGWSLARSNSKGELDPNGKPGPKPIRRMVQAGSVYFFEVMQGEASALAERCWLESVSDGEQDQRDGFGLAVWGAW